MEDFPRLMGGAAASKLQRKHQAEMARLMQKHAEEAAQMQVKKKKSKARPAAESTESEVSDVSDETEESEEDVKKKKRRSRPRSPRIKKKQRSSTPERDVPFAEPAPLYRQLNDASPHMAPYQQQYVPIYPPGSYSPPPGYMQPPPLYPQAYANQQPYQSGRKPYHKWKQEQDAKQEEFNKVMLKSGRGVPFLRKITQPGKCQNAYFFYQAETRPQVKRELEERGEEYSNTKASKIMGARWHDLSSHDKRKYYVMQEAAKKEHDKVRDEYRGKLFVSGELSKRFRDFHLNVPPTPEMEEKAVEFWKIWDALTDEGKEKAHRRVGHAENRTKGIIEKSRPQKT